VNAQNGKTDELAIVPVEQQSGLVRLVATPGEIVQAWKEFDALKPQILDKSDLQRISGRDAIKKSGWRKIAAAFGISLETVEEKRLDKEDGTFTSSYTVRAVAPGGRHCDGVGAASSNEANCKQKPEHNTPATAYTRAANRAISDLVGGGDVSAEELEATGPDQLSDAYYNRLLTLARDIHGEEGQLLTEMITKVGRHFSQDDAVAIGKKLGKLAIKPAIVDGEIVQDRATKAADILNS